MGDPHQCREDSGEFNGDPVLESVHIEGAAALDQGIHQFPI